MDTMEEKPEWKIKGISEDWHDYLQLELLDDNFKRAPPISVAEYKARTSEVLPQGIFDEHDIDGIAGTGKFSYDCYQEYELCEDDKTVATKLNDRKPGISLHLSNGKDNITMDQQLFTDNASNKPEKQKKKKKKFKQLDLHNPPSQTSKWNQPWVPDFTNKFKNNEEFPLL